MKVDDLDTLRRCVRVGVLTGTEVTCTDTTPGHLVTQVFCSPCTVTKNIFLRHNVEEEVWEPLARLVLEAQYEATLRVAVQDVTNTTRHVYLTLLDNPIQWVMDAIDSALATMVGHKLHVHIVLETPYVTSGMLSLTKEYT